MLNKTLLALALLCLPSLAQAESVGVAFWAKCTTDSECVSTVGPCGEAKAVNTEFAEEMKQRWLEEGRMISCQSNQVTEQMQPACTQGACTMISAKAD